MIIPASVKPLENFDDLRLLYTRMIGQWSTEMGHVANIIGGANSQEKYGDQPRTPVHPGAPRRSEARRRTVHRRERIPDADVADRHGHRAAVGAVGRGQPHHHRAESRSSPKRSTMRASGASSSGRPWRRIPRTSTRPPNTSRTCITPSSRELLVARTEDRYLSARAAAELRRHQAGRKVRPPAPAAAGGARRRAAVGVRWSRRWRQPRRNPGAVPRRSQGPPTRKSPRRRDKAADSDYATSTSTTWYVELRDILANKAAADEG